MLVAALEAERSPWVASALQEAINGLGSGQGAADLSMIIEETNGRHHAIERGDESAVVEQLTKILMHELLPIIGRLEVKAYSEIESYSLSKTAEEIAKLKQLVTSIKSLATAARVASADHLELSCYLRKTIVDAFGEEVAATAAFSGPSPLTVVADKFLLHVIVTNAFKNSLESFHSRGAHDDDLIVITWGSDRTNYWIAITDNGTGFSAKQTEVVQPGFSSKKDHVGFGLFIMDQAAHSLDGRIVRSNGWSGGAIVRFSWPKVAQ